MEDILKRIGEMPTEALCELSIAIRHELNNRERELQARGGLTNEEWDAVERRDLYGCVRSIRNRTGLDLAKSKAYMDRARLRGRPTPV